MDISGNLNADDALKLIRCLRFAQKNLGERAHIVVTEP